MTTLTPKLFPEIKRVDHEDETSKIISNVLGDYQPSMISESSDLINISKAQMHKIRIQNIFSEFINLTEDFLGQLDDDVDDVMDEDDAMSVCEQNGDSNHHQSNEDEDDDNDDASSSSGSDSSSSSSSSGSSSSGSSSGSGSDSEDEEKEKDTNGHIDEEPRSWNLEQFMVQAVAAAPAPSIIVAPPVAPAPPVVTVLSAIPPPSAPAVSLAPTPPPVLPSTPVPQKEIETPPIDDLMITVDLKKLRRVPRLFQIKREQPNSISSSQVSNTIPVNTTSASITNNVHSAHIGTATTASNTANTTTISSAAITPITTIGSISTNITNTTPTPTPNPPSNPSTTSSSHTNSGHFSTAKAIKHEADAERDRTKQALKYLRSAMYFIMYAHEAESVENGSSPAVPLYASTVGLIKHVIKSTRTDDTNTNQTPTSQKLHTLGCRCLSLLYLRIYKIRSRDTSQRDTQLIQSQPKIEPDPVSLTVAIKYQVMSAYQRQLAIMENLRGAHEYWSQADRVCEKNPAVRIFFSTLDTNCGPLTMICPFNKMMEYIRCALDFLSTH